MAATLMMKRRFFTHAIAGAIGASALTACRQSPPVPTASPTAQLDQPNLRWRMATSWPKSVDVTFGAVDQMCQMVRAMTDGRFVITPYAAGELAPGLEVLQAVQDGRAECGHTAGYYYINENPALAFATTVPFGLNAQQQNAWMYYGGGLEMLQKIYTDFGVINFPGGSTGTQMGGWFKQVVNTPADLQGRKIRIPGLGGQVMTRLGAEVVVLPGNEIFAALEQGTLDAAEWVGPYDDEKLGLNRVAPFYYYPGWWEPGTTYEFQVNLQQWQQLPQAYRDIFQAAAAAANLRMLAHYDAVNGEALQRLVLGGTRLLPYSQNILQAAQREALALYEEQSAQNPTFRQVYQQWRSFREQIYQWHRVNELGFSSFVINTVTN